MSDENVACLDTWGDGWARGDSAIIYRLLDDSYLFSGLPNTEPVDKRNMKMFWVGFRSGIEEAGGPKAVSSNFAKFKNVMRRMVEDTLVESGHWEIAGFGAGLYLCAARDGKVLWEQTSVINTNILGLSWEEYSMDDGAKSFQNQYTLNLWRERWSRGATADIVKLQDKDFTFTWMAGSAMEKVVPSSEFFDFFENFKAQAAAAGGPPVGSTDFMTFRNIILTQIGDTTVEIAGWQVPGFADSTYIVGARDNKLIWARVIV
eukprot:GFUD01009019.1.p1 GENE.GFUD01009019.1~~GFUD01009019.1.p1  ORF type:complete len:261 (-),score=82.23 GFUD01009019.1:92-874(-)